MALKRIVLAGGTGFVGRHLMEALVREGTEVTVLTRVPQRVILPKGAWARGWDKLPDVLEGADAVINLAGEGIADQRWSAVRKRTLLESRTLTTRRLVDAIGKARTKPGVLVNASAIGIYGTRIHLPVTEEAPPGKGFLADVCKAWEAEADALEGTGVRLVKVRLGVVLASGGGALPKMALPLKLFLGTRLGDGRQGLSWIHIQDLVRLLLEVAANPRFEGPVNATSPHPITNAAFTRALANQLHRPVWPVPAFATRFALKALLGEMGEEMLLQGVFACPRKALDQRFNFTFETIEAALEDLFWDGR